MDKITIEQIPLGSKRIKIFADFPWKLYYGDPNWTPPLRADLLGNRLLGMVGLLTPSHPYHKWSDVTHFVAWLENKPVGRISAAVNRRFNEYYISSIGFFGFFETIDNYEVAKILLDNAKNWLKERNMTVMRGPGEYSNATHERQGILIEGFEYPPTVELTHNPPYYSEFLEKYGLRKAKDYHAFYLDITAPANPQLSELAQAALSRKSKKIRTRPLNMRKLRSEIGLIIEVYNESWAKNWGFLPVTDEEANLLADSLRLIVDPGLVRFGYVNDELAAVFGAFPDPYYALKPKWKWYGDSDFLRIARLLMMRGKIPRTRLMFFGVKPKYRYLGVDAVLYNEAREYAIKKGYKTTEGSLILEDNEGIIGALTFMGAKKYKTWRIYEMELF